MAKRHIEKLKRLRQMTAREIAYRLREKLEHEAERVKVRLGLERLSEEFLLWFSSNGGTGSGNGSPKREFSFKRYLEEGPARRFYFPAVGAGRERLRRLVEGSFPHWIERAVEEAEELCRHRVELLGYGRVELDPEIDWHRDPITGRSWQRRFWADYDLVRDCSGGDPKVVHELNRHQHLPRLAKAYFYTGEEQYAREAIAQMESWIEQNPPSMGINWQSSLEIGLRAISWLWTIFFLLPAQAFDEQAARRIGQSLLFQLDHVYRYPSLYSSPNTHLLGEAAALFIAGLLFPELERAREWRQMGASLLIAEMERQVSSEGVHSELSSYYHCYALDFYLQALVLAQRNRFELPDWVWHRLCRMIEFLMHITLPGGSVPLIGDDDGGRALQLAQTDYSSFRDALCTGAVVFHRQDFKRQAGEFFEETLWLLGEDARHIYLYLGSAPPLETRAFYQEAGYFIQRSDWSERASQLIFDCGGMGICNAGHGHADALSIVFASLGKEILIDPGTFVYNCAPEWRDFFRSTRAHNTVVVDGSDQSEPGGTFNWKRRTAARVLKQIVLPSIEYVEGEHNGYSRFAQGIIHRRRLLYLRPDYWLVLDDFRGEGEHSFDFYFHFSPEVALSECHRAGEEELDLVARAGEAALLIYFAASARLGAEIISGRTAPVQGWASRRYGEKRPAPAMRASLFTAAPAAAVSAIVPLYAQEGAGFVGRRLELDEGRGVCCAFEHGGYHDIVMFSTDSAEMRLENFSANGDLFWLRTEGGRLVKLLAINASCFRANGNTLFEHTQRLSYILIQFHGELVAMESDRG